MQQIWLLLLDDRFMTAFREGILVLCSDDILRRLFLRIFIYSADYPEKYVALVARMTTTDFPSRCLVACVKFLGRCACVDCLITKDSFWKMGTQNDKRNRKRLVRTDTEHARRWMARVWDMIFHHGSGPESNAVLRTPLQTMWSLNPMQARPTR